VTSPKRPIPYLASPNLIIVAASSIKTAIQAMIVPINRYWSIRSNDHPLMVLILSHCQKDYCNMVLVVHTETHMMNSLQTSHRGRKMSPLELYPPLTSEFLQHQPPGLFYRCQQPLQIPLNHKEENSLRDLNDVDDIHQKLDTSSTTADLPPPVKLPRTQSSVS